MTGPVAAKPRIDGYYELWELATLFGLYPATIRRRLRAHGRPLYAHPADRRLRLVKEADARAIFELGTAPERTSPGAAGEE